jgi:hypothetical protein|tara:strand:+ start:118 stop:270 length:153 start_codon:yes stop_codon:yes gene_type:complete
MKKENDNLGEKKGQKTDKPKKKEANIISEELVRWMTEGTDPNNAPRSDCG